MSHRRKYILRCIKLLPLFAVLFFTGCKNSGNSPSTSAPVEVNKASSTRMKDKYGSLPVTSAPGTSTLGNDRVSIDVSNVSEGYFYIHYQGDNPKVKMQLTGPDSITYTYNINTEPASIAVTAGSGSYQVRVFEHISGKNYSVAFSDNFDVSVTDDLKPYLYPNMYVNYSGTSKAVSIANDLAASANSDLEAVASVYHYVADNIAYDEAKAANVESNYLPDIDKVLQAGKGICFDYAALMAAMLRSQGIPTRLEIGYSKDAYHAWVSVYIEDIGWIDSIIKFDGNKWTLMDPTLAANANSSSKVKEYIGDGSNYRTMYSY